MQIDISRTIGEAIYAVIIPEAGRRVGKELTNDDLQANGMREQRVNEDPNCDTLESVEFFYKVNGRYETVGLLVVSKVGDDKVLVEAEAGSNFE